MFHRKNATFVLLQHSFDETSVNRIVFYQQNMNFFMHGLSLIHHSRWICTLAVSAYTAAQKDTYTPAKEQGKRGAKEDDGNLLKGQRIHARLAIWRVPK